MAFLLPTTARTGLRASSSVAAALRPLARTQHAVRTPYARFSSSTPEPARTPIGRITPKRIAIPLPPGSGTNGPSHGGGLPTPTIWQPILFCLLLGGGGYVYAAQYTNSDTEHWANKLGSGKWWRKGQEQPADREIARAKVLEQAKTAQEKTNKLKKTLHDAYVPEFIRVPILRLYILAQETRINTPPAELAPMQIIGVMGLVFLGWRFRRLEPFMQKWWTHNPVVFGGQRAKWADSITLFTSTLSHRTLAHFAFNSIALSSFGVATFSFLATPPPGDGGLVSSTQTPHFFAFLLLGGLFSSLASHLFTNMVRLPRLLRILSHPSRLSSPQALANYHAILPSLGASGAIYAALTLTACAYPDTSVGIIFVPFISFPIGLGVAGMVTLDIIGLIRGWRMFDHVAHLGGAVFGLLYYEYGRQAWNWLRRQLGARERSSSWFS